MCRGNNLDKYPKAGKDLVCSLQGKKAMDRKRKRGERDNLGEVGRGLTGHNKGREKLLENRKKGLT